MLDHQRVCRQWCRSRWTCWRFRKSAAFWLELFSFPQLVQRYPSHNSANFARIRHFRPQELPVGQSVAYYRQRFADDKIRRRNWIVANPQIEQSKIRQLSRNRTDLWQNVGDCDFFVFANNDHHVDCEQGKPQFVSFFDHRLLDFALGTGNTVPQTLSDRILSKHNILILKFPKVGVASDVAVPPSFLY